jgi:hypothetical protein
MGTRTLVASGIGKGMAISELVLFILTIFVGVRAT